MISKELAEAAVEINSILEYMTPEILQKIPKDVIKHYENIASKTYKFNYDENKNLDEQNISKATQIILSQLYKDYIANKEEKIEYNKKIIEQQYKEDLEKRKKYNPDNIFKNAKSNTEEINNNLPIIVQKNTVWQKIKIFIKKVFSNKN